MVFGPHSAGELARQLGESGQEVFLRELVSRENTAARRLRDAYRTLLQPTRDVLQRWETRASTDADFRRLSALQELADSLEYRLGSLTELLEQETRQVAQAAIDLGLQYSEASTGFAVGWNTPDPAAIRRAINYLDSAPMQQALERYGAYHAGQVTALAQTGIAAGWGPVKIAQALNSYVEEMPLADAERMMRTVSIYSYRDANLEAWRENPNVVGGWWWRSALDQRTCMACVALHGSEYGLNERFNDHHRGRCGPVPILEGRARPGAEAGQRWFESQPEWRQRQQMEARPGGRALWQAYQAGAVRLPQMVGSYQNAVFGEMRTVAPLKSVVGADEALRYARLANAEAQASRATVADRAAARQQSAFTTVEVKG